MARYRGTHKSATYTTGDESRRGPRSKWRKGVAGTALAAAAMAALTASQAPGAQLGGSGGDEGKDRGDSSRPDLAPGDDSYHTELPPLESPAPPKSHGAPDAVGSHSGIPATVLAAYKKAERALASTDRGCGLRWELLAAIGKVESGQARGGAVDKEGTTLKPILGPVLNGSGFARIEDTDGGRFDEDARFDRAVGPMQFIPSTWSRWGTDGNGDGTGDPNNIYDAALAAGEYLCAGGKDLGSKSGLDRAILSYNHSRAYLRTVLAWYEFYREGTHSIPDGNGPLPTTPGAGEESDAPGKGKGNGSGGGSDSDKPGKDKPGKGDGGDGGDGEGGGDDRPSPAPSKPATLEPVSKTELSVGAGQDFEDPPKVKVLDKAGKPVEGAEVKFEITGDSTGSEFEGKGTVKTRTDGTAGAPTLDAGDTTGRFTVTATVVGSEIDPASFVATVEPRATALTRTAGSLTASKGSHFAERTEVKATYKGKAAANVPMTATLLTEDGEPLGKGPRFNLLGEPDRTHSATTADGLLGLSKKGVLRLPTIYTDEATGTFLLRLTTPDGPTLDIKLKVTG
ncbi:lytic murein transglycosylase [Streptomyces ovatisporus]|uniref:Lytic murein transglycosylase n=1 Tax=Streptomyces ovatisporus TaxID=1128682 RepID=A0ABV9AEC7_9ACTN